MSHKTRKFKVKVPNLTLPGAGMSPGVTSGRPFAYQDEIVTERELGKHLLGLHDAEHERTRGIIEEVFSGDDDEVEAPENRAPFTLQQGHELTVEGQGSGRDLPSPWEGYDDLTAEEIVDELKGSSPETVEKVKQYERLQSKPRKTILDYVPSRTDAGSPDAGGEVDGS